MKVIAFLLAAALQVPAWSQNEIPAPFDDGDAVETTDAEPTRFDPDATRPKMVQVMVEWVEMSHEQLTELMFLSNPPSSDATPLRKTLVELVKSDKAKVLETAMVVARSGEKATTESICEFIYPTEYKHPEVPKELNVWGPEGGGPDSRDGAKSLSVLRSPPLPFAFETRHLGHTVEIAPVLGPDDRIIDLNIAPELAWHTDNTVWQETTDGLGNTNRVEMPQMYSLRCHLAITCIDGQYNLIAIQSPKDQTGRTDFDRKVMVLVRCDVQVVKEGE